MPVIQQLVNLDTVFARLSHPPLIVNDMMNFSAEEKEINRGSTMTLYTSDMVSTLPMCQCGDKKGEYAIGTICDICGTPVISSISDIEPNVWCRRPEGVHALINPIVLIMLINHFTKSGFSVIQWILDRTYRPTVRTPAVMNSIETLGIQRGYNYFVQNFDAVIETLFRMQEFSGKKTDLYELIKQNRSAIFTQYLPMPNKSLLVIERTNVGTYVDEVIVDALDAIGLLMSIDSPLAEHNIATKENRTARALIKLASFYEGYVKKNEASHPGIFRRHVYGCRMHFSFRSVISSLTDAHSYDEMHAPWGVGVVSFRPHLINKLLKKGWKLNDAIGFLTGHVEKYHPLLDELLQEIINESPNKRIIVTQQRNPSLLQGSALTVGITKFKTDPRDHTASISILTVASTNADFDGRQQHCHR